MNEALTNLRWIAWRLSEIQREATTLFELKEFTPLEWSKAHGCTPKQWSIYKKAHRELENGVGLKNRMEKRSDLRRRVAYNLRQRKRRAQRFVEIMNRLRQQWREEIAQRTP